MTGFVPALGGIRRQAFRLGFILLGLGPALGNAVAAPAEEGVARPYPCFVPPHPLKQGFRPPPPPADPAGQALPHATRGFPSLPVGGAAGAYHDDHLRESGLFAAAQAAEPETLRALALLVDFDDVPMGASPGGAPADSVELYFDRIMLFLHQTYDQMSGGLVQIEWEVSPRVYRLPQTMAWYGDDVDLATREAALVYDAVQTADDEIDFSRYNRFLLFHAGPGQEADINNDSTELIWSVYFRTIDFQYWLDAPPDCIEDVYSPACAGIRTDDIDPATNQPFYLPGCVIAPETETQDGYSFGILGVVAHEFGHSFGLPDLYDTTAPEDWVFADSQGIGTFGLMGAGIWNENGFFPAEMEAWSKFYVGWLRPRVVRPNETAQPVPISLEAVVNDRRTGAVRIPLGGDEYFLIENRRHDYNGNGRFDFDDQDEDGVFDFWIDSYQGCEFDWFLPQETAGAPAGQDGSGLLIWHVDESIIRDLILYNLVNSDALHKGVDLEEADGIQDLDRLQFTFEAFGDSRDSWWAPWSTAFAPDTEPNTDGYGDAHTGIRITDISGPGPTMTFTVEFRSPGIPESGDLRDGWPRDLSGLAADFQPLAADLDGDGRKEIIVCAASDTGAVDPATGRNPGPVSGSVRVLREDGTPVYGPGAGPNGIPGGRLRAEPVLANLDDHPLVELIWVSGESLLVMKGDGTFLGEGPGLPSPVPVPYFTLPADPGRVSLAAGHLEAVGTGRFCGNTSNAVADDRPEILVSMPDPEPGYMELRAIAPPLSPGGSTHSRVVLEQLPGHTVLAPAFADLDSVDGGLAEIVTSVRTESGGYLAVSIYDHLDGSCTFDDVRTVAFSLGDSVAFTAPVVGDLNRDGLDEIVVGGSDGIVRVLTLRIHSADGMTKELGPLSPALLRGSVWFDNSLFQSLNGWPVGVGTLADDDISLADVDGDGYLEVLVFGPLNSLHILNYNGTSILTLPTGIPAEDRFTQPFLSPLVLDVDGSPGAELLLPMPDGQVRAHDPLGQPLPGWSFLGGGNQRSYPVVTDLEGDGILELVTVEDVVTGVPVDGPIADGDEADILVRSGRVLVREVGPGTGAGPWPLHRADAGRTGRVRLPAAATETLNTLMTEAFVVPNPVVGRSDLGFHYRIRSDVNRMQIEVLDGRGEPIRALEGSIFGGTDNLVRWDLRNERGTVVAPGIYLARFEAQAGSSTQVHIQPFVVLR